MNNNSIENTTKFPNFVDGNSNIFDLKELSYSLMTFSKDKKYL